MTEVTEVCVHRWGRIKCTSSLRKVDLSTALFTSLARYIPYVTIHLHPSTAIYVYNLCMRQYDIILLPYFSPLLQHATSINYWRIRPKIDLVYQNHWIHSRDYKLIGTVLIELRAVSGTRWIYEHNFQKNPEAGLARSDGCMGSFGFGWFAGRCSALWCEYKSEVVIRCL